MHLFVLIYRTVMYCYAFGKIETVYCIDKLLYCLSWCQISRNYQDCITRSSIRVKIARIDSPDLFQIVYSVG